MEADREIRPQPGFQEQFLASGADITIGGGAAGCGKTWAELAAPLAWVHLPGFNAVLFRRTTVQVTNPGGPWDESHKLYHDFHATSTQRPLRWTFPSDATVSMAHLELEKDMYDWQGAQIALLIFDELCHFSAEQFWYLQSRNRSTCGIRPYTLASCNPDPDSWVAKLIEWWIDQETGFPIPERAGALRYFTRVQGEMVWGDSAAEVRKKLPPGSRVGDEQIQSMTFVPGKLEENKILEEADPTYRGKLEAMSRVNRARLLDGNWKIRASSGSYFKRSDVTMLDAAPANLTATTRRWDLAASEPTETNKDPDWTCGIKMGRYPDGRFVVLHAELARVRAGEVRALVKRVAVADGLRCSVGIPQDPAQAGKDQAESYVLDLAGFEVYTERETGDKETRAEPCAAQWQHQNIDVVKGPWNDLFFAQLEAFPDAKVHDDAVDALSGAFRKLLEDVNMFQQFMK
jgi:predicted phage terminase large subunit-like protein